MHTFEQLQPIALKFSETFAKMLHDYPDENALEGVEAYLRCALAPLFIPSIHDPDASERMNDAIQATNVIRNITVELAAKTTLGA